jgi:hypothetical protein
MMYREDGASVFEQATGHSPNPDRKSNARKRRERMKVIATVEQDKWWLDIESGMLRPEVIQRVLEITGER